MVDTWLEVNEQSLKCTSSGFLRHREDWHEAVAEAIAEREAIRLTADHWELIHFIRDYYQLYHHLPNARLFTQAVRKQLGAEKGHSRYLHGLFPEGPVKYVCMIAGLAKPPGCI